MVLKDIQEALKTIGIPIAFYEFPKGKAPTLPFIIYYDESGCQRGGDLCICIEESNVSVELYSKGINKQLEEQIKRCLITLGLEFEQRRQWIKNEEFWQTVFDFNIVNKNRGKG